VATAAERGWKMESAPRRIRNYSPPRGAKAGFCDGHH